MDKTRLEAAYQATAYVVETPAGARLVLRCGERSEDLDRHLEGVQAADWAFVTACNPRSMRLGDAENTRRMERLDAVLRQRGLAWLTGTSHADAGDWPPEPSRLVLGIDESEAIVLGRLFEQNAILAGARGQAARLVWLG